MGNWVYRRPFRRVSRPKIPLTRGRGLLIAAFVRRRAVARRRILVRLRRAPHVFGKTAAVAAAGHVALRARVRIRGLQRRPVIRRAAPVFTREPVVVNNKTGPIFRFRRAVARMRHALRARLRWKPRPEEIPPIILEPRTRNSPKGRVTSPGAIRGRISGGAL